MPFFKFEKLFTASSLELDSCTSSKKKKYKTLVVIISLLCNSIKKKENARFSNLKRFKCDVQHNRWYQFFNGG